jgi:O-antigen/teichoic acid export membrane protein
MVGAFVLATTYLRALPPSSAGLVLFIYSSLAVAAAVVQFGSNSLAMRDAARDPLSAVETIGHSLRLTICLTPIVGAFFTVALYIQGHQNASALTMFLATLTILPWAISSVAGAALRGLGMIAAGTMAEVGLGVWIAAFGMATSSFLGHASATAGVGWLLFGNAAAAIWSCVLLVRHLPELRTRRRGLWTWFGSNFRVLSSFLVTALGTYLFAWMPVFVLGFAVADSQDALRSVATYNAAARPAQFVSVIALMQMTYLGPRFAQLFHAGDIPGLVSQSRRATAWAALGGGVVAFVCIALPSQALSIFGDYGAAAPSLRVLSLGALLVVMTGPCVQVMMVVGLERAAGRYTLILLGASAGVLPWLASYGTTAVAAGSAVGSVTLALLCWWRVSSAGIEAGPVRLRR